MNKYSTIMDNVTSDGSIPQDWYYYGFSDWTDKAEIIDLDASVLSTTTDYTPFFAFGLNGWNRTAQNCEICAVGDGTISILVSGDDTSTTFYKEYSCSDWANIRIIYNPTKGFYVNGKHADVPEAILTSFNERTTDSSNAAWHGYGVQYSKTAGVVYNAGLYNMNAEDWPDYGGVQYLDYDGLTYFKQKCDTTYLTSSHTPITTSLTVDGWSSNSQTVSVTGVTASNTIIVSPAASDVTNYATAGIVCSAQAADTLIFTCTTAPTATITVNVVILS